MKHYNHITTLPDNTPVSIDFESDGFTIDINKMTDLNNGDAIAPDLLDQDSYVDLYNELMEFAVQMA